MWEGDGRRLTCSCSFFSVSISKEIKSPLWYLITNLIFLCIFFFFLHFLVFGMYGMQGCAGSTTSSLGEGVGREALIRSVCQYLWCKYSYHGWFQAAKICQPACKIPENLTIGSPSWWEPTVSHPWHMVQTNKTKQNGAHTSKSKQ